jgi:hypothetical protein
MFKSIYEYKNTSPYKKYTLTQVLLLGVENHLIFA